MLAGLGEPDGSRQRQPDIIGRRLDQAIAVAVGVRLGTGRRDDVTDEGARAMGIIDWRRIKAGDRGGIFLRAGATGTSA